MNENNLPERLLRFSADVKHLVGLLAGDEDLTYLCNQLIKSSALSSTSYAEAQSLGSGSDFGFKINSSLKEMRESNYLLRIISTKYREISEIDTLIKESNELKSIILSMDISVTIQN